MPTKAMLEEENAALRRHIAELERQLAEQPQKAAVAEQVLVEAHAKLEKLFEILPVGISVLDHEGRVVKQNPMLEDALAISAEGLTHGDYRKRQYIHPDGTPFQKEEFPSARILRGEGMVRDVEIGIIKEDGQKIWTSVSAAAVPFEEWKVVIATRNITAQKLAEQALHESEGRFSFVFQGNPAVQLISRLDNGRITDVNEACCRLLELSREELIGRNAAELDFWADSAKRQQSIQENRRAGGLGPFEINVRNSLGEICTLVVSSQPIEIGGLKVLITTALDITERKRVEENLERALVKTEQDARLLNVMLENIPVGIVITGEPPDFPIKWISRFGLEMTQRAGDSLAGVASGFHQVNWGLLMADGVTRPRPEQMPLYRASRFGEQVRNEEFVLVTADQRHLTVLVDAAPLLDRDGKIIGAINAWRDITEHKRAEQALRESEQRFSSIFNYSPIAMVVSRLSDGQIVDANPAMQTLLGYSHAEMIGHSAAELQTWDNLQERQTLVERLRTQKRVTNFETIARSKSGARANVLISAQVVVLNQEQEEFLLGEIVDITERKRAERLLQERENFISSILNLTPANIYVYDMETQSNVFSMDGITRLLGYSVEDIRVMGTELFANLVHPDDLAELNAFQARIMTLADGEIIEDEIRAKHRDGSWHVLHTYESPFLRNADGMLKQKIGVSIDVTEQRQAQKDLRQSNAQLQTLSSKLIETQEKERRAIGRELHDEIGQSLTGLRIILQMAQRLPLQERETKMKQAQEVVGELIDRVSAISLDLRPPMLDDLGLLPTLLWFIGRYTSQTNIRVEFLHTGLQKKRFASVIETAVFRLVQEALTNVARHAGTVRVSVRVDASDTFIAISIEDEGRGFDIQSTFGQNDTSGLNGMRERVRLLKGDLDIDSAPGEGARISIHLPLDQKDMP